jgi:hypothetical protein
MKQLGDHIMDIEYEMHLLVGANMAINLLETERQLQDGNLVNYFKNSAYVNIRNLYEFFTSEKAGGNDVHIIDFGYTQIPSSLYATWSEALNRRVMHISPGRSKRNNSKEPLSSPQLNQQLDAFTKDINDLWDTWIKSEPNETVKDILRQALEDARKKATDDCEQLRRSLRG